MAKKKKHNTPPKRSRKVGDGSSGPSSQHQPSIQRYQAGPGGADQPGHPPSHQGKQAKMKSEEPAHPDEGSDSTQSEVESLRQRIRDLEKEVKEFRSGKDREESRANKAERIVKNLRKELEGYEDLKIKHRVLRAQQETSEGGGSSRVTQITPADVEKLEGERAHYLKKWQEVKNEFDQFRKLAKAPGEEFQIPASTTQRIKQLEHDRDAATQRAQAAEDRASALESELGANSTEIQEVRALLEDESRRAAQSAGELAAIQQTLSVARRDAQGEDLAALLYPLEEAARHVSRLLADRLVSYKLQIIQARASLNTPSERVIKDFLEDLGGEGVALREFLETPIPTESNDNLRRARALQEALRKRVQIFPCKQEHGLKTGDTVELVELLEDGDVSAAVDLLKGASLLTLPEDCLDKYRELQSGAENTEGRPVGYRLVSPGWTVGNEVLVKAEVKREP